MLFIKLNFGNKVKQKNLLDVIITFGFIAEIIINFSEL